MALSKVNFNSLNLTPTASKVVKFNSNNNGLEAGDVGGAMVLISEQTASSSSAISFTSGIDSTYKEYVFKFIDIHPSNNAVSFQFNGSADSGSNYNVTKTTSFFQAYHEEDDGSTGFGYDTGSDIAQGTGFQNFTSGSSANNNDDCLVATVRLFNPSSTTFVKHFMINAQTTNSTSDPNVTVNYIAGYFNTTSAIDAIQFKFSSGNIDSGTIKMYGVT